jgi:uncharacterized protein YjiS (DUF1127 family)
MRQTVGGILQGGIQNCNPRRFNMFLSSILVAVRRWAYARSVANELYGLDKRDLDDVGISQWQIKDVARKAARDAIA